MDRKREHRTPPLARVMGVGRQQHLTGDVNAYSTLWHSYTDDHRGQLIADFISNSDHIKLNINTPTRVPNTTLHHHQILPRYLTHCCCMPCPLQPSSSTNPGCPGPENSVFVWSRLACPISSQVTDYWGEPCNQTDEVHPVDPFHSMENLKNHFASIAFCRNSAVYDVRNGAVIELPFVYF